VELDKNDCPLALLLGGENLSELVSTTTKYHFEDKDDNVQYYAEGLYKLLYYMTACKQHRDGAHEALK